MKKQAKRGSEKKPNETKRKARAPMAPEAIDPRQTQIAGLSEEEGESIADPPGERAQPLPATQELVPLSLIVADDGWNSRKVVNEKADKELADSIAAVGLLQPLLVRTEDEEPEARYFLVSGFRRFRALKKIGWNSLVPVMVAKGDAVDFRAMNIAENEQRKDLQPWELAEACYQLSRESKWGAAQIGERLGKSPKHIANMLRVRTKLHPDLWAQMQAPEAGEKITLRWWIKLAALPQDAQLRHYERLVQGVGKVDSAERRVEKTLEPNGDASEEVESADDRPSKAKRGGKLPPPSEASVVRMKTLVAALKAPREWKRGVQQTLGWFLGESDPPAIDPSSNVTAR